MDEEKLKSILEALFAAAEKPLSVNQLFELFVGDIEQPGKDEIRKAIAELQGMLGEDNNNNEINSTNIN